MENSTINPAPPSLAGLVWRPITRDDLAALVDLAGACHLVDGGRHFMLEPENLTSSYFPDAPGAAVGAFASGAASIQLTVNVNNPGAIQAYAQLGFVKIGRRARYELTVE